MTNFFCCKNPNQTSTLGFLWNFLNPPGLMCSWREPQSLLESRCVVIEPDIIERHQICTSYLGNWRWPNRGGGENVNEGQTGQSLYRQNFMALNGSFHCLRGTSGEFYAIRSLDTWYFTHRAEVPSSCIMQGQTVCMEEVQESPQPSPQPWGFFFICPGVLYVLWLWNKHSLLLPSQIKVALILSNDFKLLGLMSSLSFQNVIPLTASNSILNPLGISDHWRLQLEKPSQVAFDVGCRGRWMP